MRKLDVNSHHDRARNLYETAMETIRNHADDAEQAIEELAILIDGFMEEASREQADALIDKILISLDKIG